MTLNTTKITKHLRVAMEIIGFILAIVGFVFNDLNKIKNITMLQLITEHWNWIVIASLFALFIRLFRLTIKEDIKFENKKLIDSSIQAVKSAQELQSKIYPQLVMNNLIIRSVLIPAIPSKDLYKLLEYHVFEDQKFNIPQLEEFGIDKKHIDKLKKKYYKIEASKISNKD